ncbi:hypothetical protein [Streptomyces sp. BH105]
MFDDEVGDEEVDGLDRHGAALHAYFEECRAVASPLVLDFLTTVPHQ